MKFPLCLCLSLLVIVPVAAHAQSKDVLEVPDSGVTITNALDGTMTYDKGAGIARVTKDVVITQKGQNLIVYAQEALYSDARNQAKATGKLSVVTRDSTIHGLDLRADFDNRQFTISENVVISAHGKNDGAMAGLRGETREKPIKVLCDRVVWDYDTKQATATGNIRIAQGSNHGTCNQIIYDETQNIVKLLGDVRLGDDKNRSLRAQEIDVYINNDVSYTPHGVLFFPEKQWMNGESEPAKPKAPVAFKPMPTIPSDVVAGLDAPAYPTQGFHRSPGINQIHSLARCLNQWHPRELKRNFSISNLESRIMKSLRPCFVLLTLSPLTAFAQPNDAASETAKTGQVNITNAREGTATYDDARGLARISKDVCLTQKGEDLVIYAQELIYLREKNQASAADQLRILTRDSTIRGQRLRVDFNQRQFTVSGGVVINSHGANDGAATDKREESSKKSTYILCDQVVWDYSKRQATATGHVTLYRGFHKDTCDKLLYNEADDTVSVVVATPKDDFIVTTTEQSALSSDKSARARTKN